MTLHDIRSRAVESMGEDVARLEKEMAKRREAREMLQQTLFAVSCKLKNSPDASSLVRQTEDLKRQISDAVIDMRHLDAKICRIKHRSERLQRSG